MLFLYKLSVLSHCNSQGNNGKINILREVRRSSAFHHSCEKWPQEFVFLFSTECEKKFPPHVHRIHWIEIPSSLWPRQGFKGVRSDGKTSLQICFPTVWLWIWIFRNQDGSFSFKPPFFSFPLCLWTCCFQGCDICGSFHLCVLSALHKFTIIQLISIKLAKAEINFTFLQNFG